MTKNDAIEEVIANQQFTDEEKKIFREMISYAKTCQKGMEDNLKNYIDEKIKAALPK